MALYLRYNVMGDCFLHSGSWLLSFFLCWGGGGYLYIYMYVYIYIYIYRERNIKIYTNISEKMRRKGARSREYHVTGWYSLRV